MSIADCSITNVLASNYCPNEDKKRKFSFVSTVDAVERSFFASFFLYLKLTSSRLLFDQITPAVQTLEQARDKPNDSSAQ